MPFLSKSLHESNYNFGFISGITATVFRGFFKFIHWRAGKGKELTWWKLLFIVNPSLAHDMLPGGSLRSIPRWLPWLWLLAL